MFRIVFFFSVIYSNSIFAHGLGEGTKILSEHGLIRIEDIRKGDRIITRNLETKKDEVAVAITRAVSLYLDAVEIFFQGASLQVSLSQEMHTKLGWKNIHTITMRHTLKTPGHPESLVKSMSYAGRIPVYSFRLQKNHTFYANGILVSSTKPAGF